MKNNNKDSKFSFGWLAVLTVLFLTLAPITFAQSLPAENAYLGSIAAPRFLPAAIKPGDTVTMAVDVTNTATLLDMVDANVTVSAGATYFQPVAPSDSVSIIHAGSTNTFIVKFQVNQNTSPGFYSLTLNLDYLRDGQPINQKQTIVVPVSVGQKNITIELNPKTINPGNQTVLDFSLTNNGSNPVSNVLLTWQQGSTGLILPIGSDNRAFAARIDPGQTVDLNYDVAADPNITTGIYPLTVLLTYNDSNGFETQNSQVGLIVGGTTDFDVSSTYTANSLSFSIANVGSNNAGAVVVSLANQAGLTVSGSNTVIVGALNIGDYSIANFTVQSGFGDANSVSGAAGGGFRRGAGGTAAGTTGSAVGSAPGASGNVPADANRGTSPQVQIPANYVADIYYTDTTGERQHIQKSFILNARSTAFSTVGAAGTGAGNGTDFVLIAEIFAVLIAGGAVYNKVKGKKSWKKFVIVAAIGVAVPLIILFFAPRGLSPTALAAVFLGGVLVLYFLMRGK